MLLAKGRAIDVIYMNLCKAFDNVSLSTNWKCVDLIDGKFAG